MSRTTDRKSHLWTAADLVERFGPIDLARVRFDPPPGMATEEDVLRIHAQEDRLYELQDGILIEKDAGSGCGWTAVDLLNRFGPIPLFRIRATPPLGEATERDVVEIRDREGRLYELVDGILVEKTVGSYESYLAMRIGHFLATFLAGNNLGIVLGADGMLKLVPNLIRIPDVSFISWKRLPGGELPEEPVWSLSPDLAVEVLSRHNSPREMQDKLREYFSTGVRLVWYIDPGSREVQVYQSPDSCQVLGEADVLDGGTVLPGFSLALRSLFAWPKP